MNSLTYERWYPVVYALLSCIAAWLLAIKLPTNDSFLAGLLSAAISASAIFVGFVATAKSILMALPKDGIRQLLNDSGYKHDLANYLNQAMLSNLMFCALNIFGFFPLAQSHADIYSPIWIALGVFCLASFWRVGKVMSLVLHLS